MTLLCVEVDGNIMRACSTVVEDEEMGFVTSSELAKKAQDRSDGPDSRKSFTLLYSM